MVARIEENTCLQDTILQAAVTVLVRKLSTYVAKFSVNDWSVGLFKQSMLELTFEM